VCVGFGFFVEFTQTEAISFIEKKCAHLTSLSDTLTQDAARIKAHIRLVLQVSFNFCRFMLEAVRCFEVVILSFLADRTNGRAYATVLRLSSVRPSVCDVMYCR